jgi:hypothetical protein
MHVDARFQALRPGRDAFIALPRVGGGLVFGSLVLMQYAYRGQVARFPPAWPPHVI